MKTVGEFSFDGTSVAGPAQYMREQGSAKLDSICSGNDAGFNAMLAVRAGKSDDLETLILVALQTNYAGWKGMQQILNMGSRS